MALCGFGPGKVTYFELPISILAGLIVILMHGLVIHRIAKIFRLKTFVFFDDTTSAILYNYRLYTTAGMICLMLKVFLLVVVELIFFPILCGWWLDICSVNLIIIFEYFINFCLSASADRNNTGGENPCVQTISKLVHVFALAGWNGKKLK